MIKVKYVYGPVQSRRLGQSLGIDPVPLKTCNWNCVYCQLGRTKPLVNERKDFFPPEEIFNEAVEALKDLKPFQIDWVTIVGSGEPLLCASIGWLMRELKKVTKIPIAVITSGSLLYLPEVREELMAADAVLPSIDAGSRRLYRLINRPHPEVEFERYIEGLIKFRNVYQGMFWPEVMLIAGLNDNEEALLNIAAILKKLKPDEIHINLPIRPPAESWVKPSGEEGSMRTMAILGEGACVMHPVINAYILNNYDAVLEAAIGIITRHPLPQEELEHLLSFRWSQSDVHKGMLELKENGRAQTVERFGKCFWCLAKSYFPQKEQSQKTFPGTKYHQN